jgi:hypothetical protein
VIGVAAPPPVELGAVWVDCGGVVAVDLVIEVLEILVLVRVVRGVDVGMN